MVTPDVVAAEGLLGDSVHERDGERLVVVSPDSAAVNARLVASGVRVREIGPERQTLEQVIEEQTSARRPGEVAR